jgi:hypothetical protein
MGAQCSRSIQPMLWQRSSADELTTSVQEVQLAIYDQVFQSTHESSKTMANERDVKKPQGTETTAALAERNNTPAEEVEATEQWLDDFTERMMHPSPEEEEFFARRRELGLGAGLDKHGKLVKSKS